MLVDDFIPQPAPGQREWFYSSLDADRGTINTPAGGNVEFHPGFIRATLLDGFVGTYSALQHTQREGLPLNLSRILPSAILPEFQARVVGVRVRTSNGRGTLQVELGSWRARAALTGGTQTIEFAVPALGDVQSLTWVLLGSRGDSIDVTRLELLVEVPRLPVAQRAFLYSYSQLLANFDPDTGLVRDRASFPAGAFDAIPVGGLLAAASVQAGQLGVISRTAAEAIVQRITLGLLSLPRAGGLLPHFVTRGTITPGTEYSSVDTSLGVLSALSARQALGLEVEDTRRLEQLLRDVAWNALTLPDGSISHGFDERNGLLPYGWRVFGGETFLVNLALASATGRIAPMDAPPTYNGSAFITSLPWAFVPRPRIDVYRNAWDEVEAETALAQIGYYRTTSSTCEGIVINRLRGSLNLALQTLGWGRYLTRDDERLQRAALENPFLAQGYRLLTR